MERKNDVNPLIEHAEHHCKSKATRLTKKRKLVLSSLIHANNALSAYEIIDLCKAEFDEVIRPMSVYRILAFLESVNLVHKVKLINKYIACSYITCEHKHGAAQFLICNGCDSVKEMTANISTMSEINTDVEQAGFQLVSFQLEMEGICNSCAEVSFTPPSKISHTHNV